MARYLSIVNISLHVLSITRHIWILFYVAFCTIMAISRQKEARIRHYALLLFRMTSRVFYSAQYNRQYCTLHAFEQFGALYMHNHDDKYSFRPGFVLGTPGYQPQSIRISNRGRVHHQGVAAHILPALLLLFAFTLQYTALQNQKAVFTYFIGELIMSFGFLHSSILPSDNVTTVDMRVGI